jgi:hypothetical protein
MKLLLPGATGLVGRKNTDVIAATLLDAVVVAKMGRRRFNSQEMI